MVIIAEFEEDSAFLRHTLRYTSQEEEQFCVLYVPCANLADTAQVAQYPEPA